jgi:hypothetical protein
MMRASLLAEGGAVNARFSDWLNSQMDRVGIRSGRRLAIEAGLDEEMVLDWALGRRVPQPGEVDRLARFFGVPASEAQTLRAQTEQLLALSRGNR